jgi:hypothetical protein
VISDNSASRFTAWLRYFEQNPRRQRALEAEVDWDYECALTDRQRLAFVRSFQRFELGENGDGRRLLAKAAAAGDSSYLEALRLLVVEEQKHSALFRRGLGHLNAPTLNSHWSDTAFTVLRRGLGLRTEIALFLIAETVALGYFKAIAADAPDPVLRGIGRRILTDEVEHIRFQIDRLRVGFESTPSAARALVGISWGVIAIGATTVLVADHASALRACGLRPLSYWLSAMRQFRRAARTALRGGTGLVGPLTQFTVKTPPAVSNHRSTDHQSVQHSTENSLEKARQ